LIDEFLRRTLTLLIPEKQRPQIFQEMGTIESLALCSERMRLVAVDEQDVTGKLRVQSNHSLIH
jgi:hypothetical protein